MKKRVFIYTILSLLLVSCNREFNPHFFDSSSFSSTSNVENNSSVESSFSINSSEESSSGSDNSSSSLNQESSSHVSSSSSNSSSSSSNSSSNSSSVDSHVSSFNGTKEYDDLSIHFLELGNGYAGDSVYIKAGDTDILIDAGSRDSSAPTITKYVNTYCTDKKLEYVIATHAHQDHIAGFVGTNNNGIFDSFDVGVIIDYAQKNSTSKISKNYETKRDAKIQSGAKHYTAKDCIDGTNGGSKSFVLAKGITLNILDQDYYHKKSSDENNHSVCALISQGDNHFLLTGDLEKDGEESLVKKNPNLPHVRVFKGGHHGSKTSSNEALLSKITPEVVCVCTCAGTDEYTNNRENQFPTQDFINRVAKYTDRVYVTSQVDKWETKLNDKNELYPYTVDKTKYKSMNGNIVVTSTYQSFEVHGSNNDTKLKDTEWFNSTLSLNDKSIKMRTWPSNGVNTN